MRTMLMLAVFLLPHSAAAAPLGSRTGGWTAEYTGYSHGFTVLKLAGTLALSQEGYRAHVTFHTAGMAGLVVHTDNDSQAAGTFRGAAIAPASFEGSGHLRGTDRLTRIAYPDGNPQIRALSPPVERERTAVPAALTLHTIDTLSAVTQLIRNAALAGACDGAVTTFDGRRLATQTAHTAGIEVLPETGRGLFHGPALRCDFEGRQLGGFVTSENEDDLRKPRHGTAWLAALLPEAPPVPVRVAFENRLLGQVTLYLTAVSKTEPP